MTVADKARKLTDVVAVGDVHGLFGEFRYRIKERYKIFDSIICVCGDFGMGFHRPEYYVTELAKLNRIAEKNNDVIIVVRGNHDDPACFTGAYELGNIKLVSDYSTIQTKCEKILFIGGGVSIDRTQRALEKTYWPDETSVYDEERLYVAGKPDILITHNAPSFCTPTTKEGISYWMKHDTTLGADCDRERQIFTRIYDFLEDNDRIPHTWAYGHYHMSDSMLMLEDTEFKALNELEFFLIQRKNHNEETK